MNSRDFCFWMQGLFELGDPKTLNEKQTDLIKKHLNMVFIHEIDPSFPAEQQEALNDAHSGKTSAVEPKRPPILEPSYTPVPFSGIDSKLVRC